MMQTTGVAAAYGGAFQERAAQNQPTDLTVMQALHGQLQTINSRVHEAGQNLHNLGERLFGGEPTQAEPANARVSPVPNGTIAEAGQIIENILGELNHLESRITRLQKLA